MIAGTKEYVIALEKRKLIESAMTPREVRYTRGVRSQAWCKINCYFCMTGKNGFKYNLSVSEIVSQYIMVGESALLTNTVFMGMGEPLDNIKNVLKAIEVLTADWGFAWSPKRITLSSIGVTDKPNGNSPLREFLDNCKCHLAISLHNPFPNERLQLMPMEKPFPIEKTKIGRASCRERV